MFSIGKLKQTLAENQKLREELAQMRDLLELERAVTADLRDIQHKLVRHNIELTEQIVRLRMAAMRPQLHRN